MRKTHKFWALAGACLLAILLACGCATQGNEPAQPEVATSEEAESSADAKDDEQAQEQEESQSEDDSKPKKDKEKKDKEKERAASEEPAWDPEVASSLEGKVGELVDQSSLHTGVAVIDLTNGMPVSYNGDESMTSASMIKLIIAHAFLRQVDRGAFSLDDSYTLQAGDLVGGTGSLAGRGAGAAVSYRDLVTGMISESDNTATNVLINAIGMKRINRDAKRLGLKGTKVRRLMMDEQAIAQGIENSVSANDIATLLQMAYEGTFVSEEHSELVMDALKNQEDHEGICQYLPSDASFAHKTGTLNNARHDGGIVLCDHPFILVVLCTADGYIDQGAAHALMGSITNVVYDTLVR